MRAIWDSIPAWWSTPISMTCAPTKARATWRADTRIAPRARRARAHHRVRPGISGWRAMARARASARVPRRRGTSPRRARVMSRSASRPGARRCGRFPRTAMVAAAARVARVTWPRPGARGRIRARAPRRRPPRPPRPADDTALPAARAMRDAPVTRVTRGARRPDRAGTLAARALARGADGAHPA